MLSYIKAYAYTTKESLCPCSIGKPKKMIFTPRSQSDKGLVGDFKWTLGDVEILYGFEISKQMTQVLKLEWANVRHRSRFRELKKKTAVFVLPYFTS